MKKRQSSAMYTPNGSRTYNDQNTYMDRVCINLTGYGSTWPTSNSAGPLFFILIVSGGENIRGNPTRPREVFAKLWWIMTHCSGQSFGKQLGGSQKSFHVSESTTRQIERHWKWTICRNIVISLVTKSTVEQLPPLTSPCPKVGRWNE